MEKIAVFDFDKTLYKDSSKVNFFKFITDKMIFKKTYILPITMYYILHEFKLLSKTEYKELFFQYLDHIPPDKLKKYAEDFWALQSHKQLNRKVIKRLKKLRKKQIKIFCLTGAPEIYIKPIIDALNIDHLIGTKLKYKKNKYEIIGNSCDGIEKIKRLNTFFKNKPYRIIEAYSDKEEDILKLSEKAFLVKKNEIVDYK